MIEIALAAALATQEPLGGFTTAPANEEAAVIATVEQLFDAMRRHDVDAFSALLVPDGNTFRVNQGPDGTRYRVETNAQDIKTFAQSKDEWVERFWDPTVKVHGPIAMFWAPYDFHVNGEFSHCGIDLFELLKTDGKWRITNASWTVQTTGCVLSPQGPLGGFKAPEKPETPDEPKQTEVPQGR